jgi:hypothetical protein
MSYPITSLLIWCHLLLWHINDILSLNSNSPRVLEPLGIQYPLISPQLISFNLIGAEGRSA